MHFAGAPADFLEIDLPRHKAPRLHNVGRHPISQDEARLLCNPHVGLPSSRFFLRWRNEWWDLLRSAEDPEVKLSCERMINAINIAFGMDQHERGADLARANREAADRASADAAEAAAIDRWR
ncbi:hypothetical protein C9E82_13270 [Paracoccus siganidrum]|uniref:Uncharacterized protein n=2 Tax=Paracoccus siganidrum TaxID=1276757 RepID=A0A419A8I9_9RHOB|nr:hypothetical protein D3P05_07810 [Paracoccus siganidrum]RMC33415.1 hypothetical protein C9E82_13270 [Paracoccus siganidrum]